MQIKLTKQLSALIGTTIAGVALRLSALTSLIPVDYRWESYHLWQIAYYTLRIGIPNGRMWDLDGLEYFWGPAPILSESFLLWILNTTSILPFRMLNVIIGSATVALAYLVGKKYYNSWTGLLAAALVALNPITIFNSAIAMSETFGIFFLLLGILLHRDQPFYSGLALAIASLSRTEFWLISIGMIAAYLVFERNTTKMIPSAGGWLLLMAPYFVMVRAATGNPFYSFYWNFIGNIAGVWAPWYVALEVRAVFVIALIASVIGLIMLIRYRHRVQSYIVPAVSLAFLAYHGLVYTIGGLAPLFERFFILDIVVGSILVAYLSSRTKILKVTAVILIGLQLAAFFLATPYYSGLQPDITGLFGVADQIGSRYTGGTVLSDMPMITYRLINHEGLSERDILGTIYMPKDDAKAGLQWIATYNVTWLVVADPKGQSTLLFLQEVNNNNPGFLRLIYTFSGAAVYQVNLNALA